MSSGTYFARRSLPGAVLSALVGVILFVLGIAQSSALRVVVGLLLFTGGVVIAMIARRILAEAGERLFQVTVPPRRKP